MSESFVDNFFHIIKYTKGIINFAIQAFQTIIQVPYIISSRLPEYSERGSVLKK